MESLDKIMQERSYKNFFFLLILFLSFSLIGCLERFTPSSRLIAISKYPKISNYHFEKIAIFPMVKDDPSDWGTFYSTNHFLKKLTERYPKIEFDVLNLTKINEADSVIIPKLAESIEQIRHLDLDSFYESELGSSLDKENYDAIFIGNLERCYDLEGFDKFDWTPSNLYFERIYVRNCYFSYYLISLKDGRVLWRARVLGQDAGILDAEVYYSSRGQIKMNYYPPLDCAISNGIDTMMESIPIPVSKLE